MAIDFSNRYVENSRRALRFTPLYFRIKLARLIKKWRLWRLKLSSKKVHSASAECRLTESFDAGSEHFQKEGWVFIENIFDRDFHNELITNWPKRYYLEPPRELEKSYNTGFRWIYGDRPDFNYSDPHGQYPTLVHFLNYLRSSDFCVRVRKFNGANEEMALHSFILNDAGSGAEVIPHKDSNRFDPRANLNLIFFIDASGGTNSGGLTLSRDNEMKEIIFEPQNLVNTCLIYNIVGDFYHGFPPIAKGKFRRAITAQFCDKNYVTNS